MFSNHMVHDEINNYQYKEWDQETTDKVMKNLSTFTSTYSAPRTTTAAVNEAVDEIINSQKNSVKAEVKPEVKIDSHVETEEKVITNNADEDWVNSVLNG